jgi:beta-phosphoglucomutase family hydrolase
VEEMKQLHGFIFDMDGVVVDNHRFHFQAWMEFAEKYGFLLNRQIYRDTFNGKTNADLFKMIFGPLSEEKIQSYALEKELNYQHLYEKHMKAHEGLVDFLTYLHANHFKVALGTSAPTLNVDFTLDRLGLRKFFDVIVDGPQVTRGKPDPEVYLKCASLLQLAPENCVVFEDSLAGLESGQRAGCAIVGVATSHETEELRPLTNAILHHFGEAKVLLGL